VKTPDDSLRGEDQPVVGKAFLRQKQFLEHRGLQGEPRELSIGDDPYPGDGGADPSRGLPRAASVDAPAVKPSPYLAGTNEKEQLLAATPPAPELVWRSLGPSGIPHGQTYGSGPGSNPTVAGRVTAIAVDPGDSQHVLAGTGAGGIWQTRDGGATWTPQTDGQPTLSIGAMAFDPVDHSIVYAGTGEGNSEYYALGQGILVSRDGGSRWSLIARELFAGIGFYRLVVDPGNNKRILVATTGGAAVSIDAGARWSRLHPAMSWDVSLAIHGAQSEILIAAADGLFAGTGPGGFTRIGLPGLPATFNPRRERMAVTHVPDDPGQAFVFAAANGRAHLWHRSTLGGPFASVPLPAFPPVPTVNIDVLSVKQAAYDWYVAVPPGSTDVVYLGAIELVRGKLTQSGWKWSDISSRQNGDSIHGDQHTMAFDPQEPRVVYAGSDGGIFRSPDGGDKWESLNAGLAISEVEYLAQRPDETDWILAGLQDNGTVRRQDGEWTQVGLGDGGDCGTNMDDPDTCFHSYYEIWLDRSRSRGDPGSWTRVLDKTPETDQVEKLFYPPVEVNGDVVVKAGEVVWISSDSGDNWDTVRLPRTPQGDASKTSALAVPTADRVLAGTVFGDVFRIDRSQAGWRKPSAPSRPRDGYMSDLYVDPTDSQRVWATFSNPGAVFHSDDGGATWTDVTANLPSIPVNAVISDPSHSDHVWVACDVGVFESRDAGETWAVFGSGLPNALAEDLLFYEANRRLRVGTRSRGMWEVKVD
jgi:photosystem II stability/assembly factor-like uncharacterized protein